MMDTWSKEFDVTASNKLRSPKDMQYAFAYLYFLMNQRIPYDFDRVYDTILDTNGDGVLNINEIRSLTIKLHGSVMDSKDFYKYREDLFINCSLSVLKQPPSTRGNFPITFSSSSSRNPTWPRFGNAGLSQLPNTTVSLNTTLNTTNQNKKSYTPDNEFPLITKEYIKNCEAAKKKIETYYSKVRKNKFEIVDTDDVAFIMIGTNSTEVLRSIDSIRIKKQKFICLNDNMNHSNSHSVKVVEVLRDLYESIVPNASSFELPSDKTNRYLYIEDYIIAKEEIKVRKRHLYILLGIFCLCFLTLVKSCITADKNKSN